MRELSPGNESRIVGASERDREKLNHPTQYNKYTRDESRRFEKVLRDIYNRERDREKCVCVKKENVGIAERWRIIELGRLHPGRHGTGLAGRDYAGRDC